MEELATAEARSKVEKFLATETSIVSKPVDAFASKTATGKREVARDVLAHVLSYFKCFPPLHNAQ